MISQCNVFGVPCHPIGRETQFQLVEAFWILVISDIGLQASRNQHGECLFNLPFLFFFLTLLLPLSFFFTLLFLTEYSKQFQ